MEQLDDDETLNEVVIGAIANFYESINFEYFSYKRYSWKNKVENNRMNQDLIGRSGSNISENAVIKQSNILDQLHENIRNELSDQIFGIISYNPLKFIIAHKIHKQILYSNIKKKNNNKDTKNNTDFGFYIETDDNVQNG